MATADRSPVGEPRASGASPSLRGERVQARAAVPLRFRLARPADAAACAAVMRAAVRALPPGAITDRQRAAWSSLPALYHRWAMGPGGEAYLLAVRGGQVVGYAGLRGDELTAVFVRPGEQGRGTGRALVAALAATARSSGAPALTVLAARPASGFYSRLGFRPGRPARVPLPGGAVLPGARMRLPLG